ncbi:MAG TPA: MarR family transcriptional regulator [Solirubrobacteraceae bacterium]|nr:MarR family transcriptional regulator [Solirubrobacteraceae bacterium]
MTFTDRRPSAAADPPQATMRAAATELGRAFKGCMSAVRRLRGRETRTAYDELSDAQYGLLFGLRDHDALPTTELACLAGTSPATATGMLESLAASGLVSRVRSDRDRRVVLTSLTERGRALVAERHARFAPRFEAALAEFSDDELRVAAAVLHRLGAMFDEISPGSERAGEPPRS